MTRLDRQLLVELQLQLDAIVAPSGPKGPDRKQVLSTSLVRWGQKSLPPPAPLVDKIPTPRSLNMFRADQAVAQDERIIPKNDLS